MLEEKLVLKSGEERVRILTPEHQLWYACLLQGIKRASEGRLDEVLWLLSEKVAIGSFRWICETLEIPRHRAIRREVMSGKEEGLTRLAGCTSARRGRFTKKKAETRENEEKT